MSRKPKILKEDNKSQYKIHSALLLTFLLFILGNNILHSHFKIMQKRKKRDRTNKTNNISLKIYFTVSIFNKNKIAKGNK